MRFVIKGISVLAAMTLVFGVYAAENTELLDEVVKADGKSLQTADLNFQSFTSCDDMSAKLTEFVQDNFDQRHGGPMPYWRGGMVDDVAMAEENVAAGTSADGDSIAKDVSMPAISSSSTDFSTTNIQVAGVDEPELLKTDGDYLYYYNQRVQKVFVIQSPLNRATSTISLSQAKIVAIIAVPQTFSQVQLFVRPNQLVMIGSRRSDRPQTGILDTGSKTVVVTYDMRDKTTPKLTKFADLDGWYQDARLIGSKLYIVSGLGINRWRYGQTYPTAAEVRVNAEELLPKVIDVSYTKDADKKNLTLEGKTYPYHVGIARPSCAETLYVLPTKESIHQYGLSPQFTLVRALDLDMPETTVATTTTFGSTQTVHMSDKAIYLANSFWAPYKSVCPPNALCIRGGGGEQQTLLHKLAVDGLNMKYVDSALLPGSPLTQWSMDEDRDGNFRILTTTWSPQQATHLIALDKQLNQLGTLLNIEPGEQFKASRFMGDKLYLVTFEQIDPLFVIDLASLKTPKIVGELKIPGYSTYLHPYGAESNGVQRLIGLGYDTVQNQWGGTQNAGIKLDLYKVDYTKKDEKGMIAVTQEQTKTFGGKGSETEALYNPRVFVWNPTTKQVVMPLVLSDASMGKQCTTTYDADGKVSGEQCRDTEVYKTSFAGMKAIEILTTGINEVASYDYTDRLKADKQTYDVYQGQIWPWQLQNLAFRAGYVGDALYVINNLFAHFVVPGQTGQEVYVDMQ